MKTLLTIFAIGFASPAAALIIEVDLYAPGDALVTRDTDAGLDWLDVTLTLGIGGAQAVADGAGGWVDAGWRLATTAEVCGFFGSVSGYPLTCPGVTYPFRSEFGQPILDLLGVTVEREQPYGAGTLYLDQMWPAFDDGDLSNFGGGVELSVDRHTDGWVQTYLAVSDDVQFTDSALLVRAIPEPSTGALLALGLAWLALARRLGPSASGSAAATA